MRHLLIPLISLLYLLPAGSLLCQEGQRVTGPVIEDYGATFAIDDPDFKTDPEKVYRVVFDIHDRPEDPTQVNPMLATLARFLNMHVRAGVPPEHLQVAGVFHNRASPDVLDHEAYREKFGVDNPNIRLMEELEDAGARLYICGQSMYARDIDPDRLAEPVRTALSAMTVFLGLRQEGYTLIRF